MAITHARRDRHIECTTVRQSEAANRAARGVHKVDRQAVMGIPPAPVRVPLESIAECCAEQAFEVLSVERRTAAVSMHALVGCRVAEIAPRRVLRWDLV